MTAWWCGMLQRAQTRRGLHGACQAQVHITEYRQLDVRCQKQQCRRCMVHAAVSNTNKGGQQASVVALDLWCLDGSPA
jgi:hypothetical protein